MKSNGDSHQQRALFDEQPEFLEPEQTATASANDGNDAGTSSKPNDDAESHIELADIKPQQVIDEEDEQWQEQTIDDELDDTEAESVNTVLRPAAKNRWWLKFVAALALLIITIEGVTLINAVWQQQSWLSGLYAALFVLVFGAVLVVVFNEWRKLAQLAETEQRQTSAQKILDGEPCDDIVRFCNVLLPERLNLELAEPHEQWRKLINDGQSDIDVLQLFDATVVAECDQKALAVVSKSSSQAAALVALSPLAALDMFVIGWRNIRMIDDVAACYGVELGLVSRLRLIRLVIYNLIYAGASELTLDIGLQSVGADLMGKVSARGAQGLGAGLLSARLGIKAIQLCRPLPFTQPDNQPTVSDVMKHIKTVLTSKLKQLAVKATAKE
ncbi:YcjF family protein [Neiella marina]|uniref:YcjF family protein n=1 Tax=Neiella holothuriorum TaxID=2870530 RepID=A0ABS7EDF7_9GAMM|nr:TIGR01620 family protein [Neiella holothuriorum]MBW8190368.1 YcjF family protein [Neiella holothuriorum]